MPGRTGPVKMAACFSRRWRLVLDISIGALTDRTRLRVLAENFRALTRRGDGNGFELAERAVGWTLWPHPA